MSCRHHALPRSRALAANRAVLLVVPPCSATCANPLLCSAATSDFDHDESVSIAEWLLSDK
ncbi:hypothetical protein C2845_PM13G06950 [Panicum miliaceum]|uniref:Uncharacterized protein n=1 Tax=Panicum miliaceum TaxID=4540 RepID=A0A3L6RFZ0_PANMI|nr:hypothetical protein C2845_PM13G06950 [Panicum miliaceum]